MRAIGDTLPRRFKAKASGAITAGKPCIVEADGDVAQVGEAQIVGSPATFLYFFIPFIKDFPYNIIFLYNNSKGQPLF